jgi:hypothetical protein
MRRAGKGEGEGEGDHFIAKQRAYSCVASSFPSFIFIWGKPPNPRPRYAPKQKYISVREGGEVRS